MKYSGNAIFTILSWAILFAFPSFTIAQTPEEHASHHPKQQSAEKLDSTSSMTSGKTDSSKGMPGGTKTGGMMEGMGEMMKEMGKHRPKNCTLP